jgi:hypothetical protein
MSNFNRKTSKKKRRKGYIRKAKVRKGHGKKKARKITNEKRHRCK